MTFSRAWQEVAHAVQHETEMSDPPWYVDLFGEEYLRVWAPVLPPERTAQELEGIVKFLNLPAGSTVLDLCCGHGRHAIPLAQQGFRVTGLDLSFTSFGYFDRDEENQQVLKQVNKALKPGGVFLMEAALLHPDGRRTEHRYVVRFYTLRELISMLEAAGLRVEASYGGLDGSILTLRSRRLVTLSRKS